MDLWSKDAPRRTMSEAYWQQPVSWDRAAAAARRRARVFCASMADVFEERADLDESRVRLWDLISKTPNLDWLLLTKRPHNVGKMVPWGQDWPANVWLGATAENQRWAERRLPLLLQYPAAVLFASCEPLLGHVDLSTWLPGKSSWRALDWVIVGGESGVGARPMNPEWARNLRDQCIEQGVAFHFKQWGNWKPTVGDDLSGYQIRELKGSVAGLTAMANVGKKLAGRSLDGHQWDELPWHVA
jgi:protein gp37